MHRNHLLAILETYATAFPEELLILDQFRSFVGGHANCFSRACVPGHITASCWILSSDRRSALLTHHAKIGRWLQLGGHADEDPDPFAVALREAREESGMRDFTEPSGMAIPTPLDLDIHPIAAHGSEPEHLHYDLRYLLISAPGQPLEISEESKDLRWISRDEVDTLTDEQSVLRLERKAIDRLRSLEV